MNTLTHAAAHAHAPKRQGLLSRLFGFAQLAKQRQDLSTLSDAQLRDIGYTRDQALAEAQRAPWDAPSHWKL